MNENVLKTCVHPKQHKNSPIVSVIWNSVQMQSYTIPLLTQGSGCVSIQLPQKFDAQQGWQRIHPISEAESRIIAAQNSKKVLVLRSFVLTAWVVEYASTFSTSWKFAYNHSWVLSTYSRVGHRIVFVHIFFQSTGKNTWQRSFISTKIDHKFIELRIKK